MKSVQSFYERARNFCEHRILGYPIDIIVQTVVGCNLRCSHCFLTDMPPAGEADISRTMRLPAFINRATRLRHVIRHSRRMMFSTFEALMNPDLFGIMDHVLGINSRLRFPFLSNGMLLSGENVRRLSGYPLESFFISLDGTSARTVEQFKTGVKFSRVVEGIRRVAESPLGDRLGTVLVLHRGNIHEVEEYPAFVHSLGVRQISLVHLLCFKSKFESDVLYGKNDISETASTVQRCIESALSLGMSVYAPGMEAHAVGCTQAEAMFVGIDGAIGPCDMLAAGASFWYNGTCVKNEPVRFGDSLNKNPMSIFRSAVARAFRNFHRKGVIPSQCLNCIDAYGLLCSNRRTFHSK